MRTLTNNAHSLNEVLQGQKGFTRVRDGHHAGTCFSWIDDCEWLVSDLENSTCYTVDRIAVVSLLNSADADDGLNQSCLACDLEVPGGEWVVEADSLEDLQQGYGDDLEVIWTQS